MLKENITELGKKIEAVFSETKLTNLELYLGEANKLLENNKNPDDRVVLNYFKGKKPQKKEYP